MEARYNEWYDNVHIPALLKVPGVLGAHRYLSVEGEPKYIAVYELESANTPSSEKWNQAVAATPRPKDIITKNVSRNLYKGICPKK